MYPLGFPACNKPLAPTVIALIWLAALSLGLVCYFHSVAEPFTWYNNQTVLYDCKEVWSSEEDAKLYTLGVFVVTFAGPMMLLMITYGSIGWKMWKHTMPGNAHFVRDEISLAAKRKVKRKN